MGRGGQILGWGQSPDRPQRFLHVEVVIYRSIARALTLGRDWLDSAPTGLHKIERGIDMAPIWTGFWFAGPACAPVAEAAARAERVAMQANAPWRPTADPISPQELRHGAIRKRALLSRVRPEAGRGRRQPFPRHDRGPRDQRRGFRP